MKYQKGDVIKIDEEDPSYFLIIGHNNNNYELYYLGIDNDYKAEFSIEYTDYTFSLESSILRDE